jgi:hypothetical protein
VSYPRAADRGCWSGAHVARFSLSNHSELDLFHYGLARFSEEEFEAAGINAEDRFLIQFMAE